MIQMYKVIIKTKNGNKEYIVESINTPEMKELFNQPNEGVYIDTMQHYKQDLIKQRDELLSHVAGMSYNTQKALELNKKIRSCDEIIKTQQE